MVLDKAKLKIGMEKWSKEYDAKHKDYGELTNNKKTLLKLIIANMYPNIIQLMKSINK